MVCQLEIIYIAQSTPMLMLGRTLSYQKAITTSPLRGEGPYFDYAYFYKTDIDATITDNSPLLGGDLPWLRMVNQETWQTNSIKIHTGSFKLVFLWHNDGSVCNNPPIAIKNIKIRPYVSE